MIDGKNIQVHGRGVQRVESNSDIRQCKSSLDTQVQSPPGSLNTCQAYVVCGATTCESYPSRLNRRGGDFSSPSLNHARKVAIRAELDGTRLPAGRHCALVACRTRKSTLRRGAGRFPAVLALTRHGSTTRLRELEERMVLDRQAERQSSLSFGCTDRPPPAGNGNLRLGGNHTDSTVYTVGVNYTLSQAGRGCFQPLSSDYP